MNFIKLVLTEFIEVYPTSKLYWQSNRIYLHCILTLQLNEMLWTQKQTWSLQLSMLGHINLKLFIKDCSSADVPQETLKDNLYASNQRQFLSYYRYL